MGVATVVAWAVAAIFGGLSALHVYWAIRGVGGGVGLPEVNGAPAFVPGRPVTVAVAAALALAALVVLARAGIVLPSVPVWMTRVAAGVLGTVFVLRAIGERKLVGFFKRVRGTRFARWDTWLFSPLCLALGVSVLWLASV
jgi:hypothetical protein